MALKDHGAYQRLISLTPHWFANQQSLPPWHLQQQRKSHFIESKCIDPSVSNYPIYIIDAVIFYKHINMQSGGTKFVPMENHAFLDNLILI